MCGQGRERGALSKWPPQALGGKMNRNVCKAQGTCSKAMILKALSLKLLFHMCAVGLRKLSFEKSLISSTSPTTQPSWVVVGQWETVSGKQTIVPEEWHPGQPLACTHHKSVYSLTCSFTQTPKGWGWCTQEILYGNHFSVENHEVENSLYVC